VVTWIANASEAEEKMDEIQTEFTKEAENSFVVDLTKDPMEEFLENSQVENVQNPPTTDWDEMDEELNLDHFLNPHTLKVKKSEYLFMNPDTGKFDGDPGKGLFNWSGSPIQKGQKLVVFVGGETITLEEKTKRELAGKGGHFLVKPQGRGSGLFYDMYQRRRQGDLASAANSPCNMIHPTTKKYARANAELKYWLGEFYLVSTRTIEDEEEIFWNYGNTYKIQFYTGQKMITTTIPNYLNSTKTEHHQLLWKAITADEVYHKGFFMKIGSWSSALEFLYDIMGGTNIPQVEDCPSIKSLMISLEQFRVLSLSRIGWGFRHRDNQGQGFCGWEAAKMARETQRNTTLTLEMYINSVLQANEVNKMDICAADYETIKERSQKALEYLQAGMPLPLQYWCSDSNVASMDMTISKVVFQSSDQVDNLDDIIVTTEETEKGYKPAHIKQANREVMIAGTTTTSVKYFTSTEIRRILQTATIIQLKDHHFKIAARQPSEKIFSELIKLTANRIRKILLELSQTLYA
jgi:hypothetical protein